LIRVLKLGEIHLYAVNPEKGRAMNPISYEGALMQVAHIKSAKPILILVAILTGILESLRSRRS
jgi:hypothetical protein